ncbi:MAG: GDSL-type esterase/lipase family protein [Polyangiaceae bacterium]|nr:GDSL-type esterase/lipase family protein [Polyangiaceae bacterium]
MHAPSAAPSLPAAKEIAQRAAIAGLEPTAPTSKGVALPRFYSLLRALENEVQARPVHIAWLGDSHTAADFWTGEVRAQLQARFGVGGPGFFHVALKSYRHASLSFEQNGAWGREPGPPSLRTRTGDGVFGLGGIRTFPRSSSATFKAQPEPNATLGEAMWKVRVRLGNADRVRLSSGEHSFTLTGDEVPKIEEQVLPAPRGEALHVRVLAGAPQFLGGSLESSQGGVVLHTLGVDGARVETALAWNEEAWKLELAQREVGLVVLAFGTNEAFDQRAPAAYAEHYARVMARVRAAVPSADCLIIGLPDALDANGQPHPRVPEIGKVQEETAAHLGCAFFSAASAMANEGGFAGWLLATPRLAKADGIHLTISGYQLLGARTVAAIVSGYEEFLEGR